MKKIFSAVFIVACAIFAQAQNFGVDQPNPQQKLDVNGNIRLTGNSIVTNGSNSNYGATTIQGENSGWGGINFRRANGNNLGTFMIHEDYSGVYNNADNNWDWYFTNGTLTHGTIPPDRIKTVMWSGGCNFHGSAGGWNTYCNNSTDFNTAGGYITANGSGTFTVQQSGYYRINFWTISLASNYCYALFYHNGTYRHHGYEYVHGAWSDNFIDVIWPMNAGDTFYISVYNGGSYAFHSWNSQGAHSRLQVSYEGGF